MPMTLRPLAALALAWIACAAAPAAAQFQEPHPVTIPIWPNGAPGSEARRNEKEIAQDYWVRNVHNPSLTLYRPAHQNGSAIIIFPGGAHTILVWQGEGGKAGPAFNRYGITIFVLKYRLAREEGSTYTIAGDAADDARRAIRFVRAHAADYGVDPHRIGVMGFSAGGELVTLVADNPEPPTARPHSRDAIDQVSARPDFQVQVFPGPLGLPAQAVKDAPPAFLVAGSEDLCCATPTVQLYEQLRAAGTPAELHMYARAGHAFNVDETDRISVLHWPDRLADWMMDEGLMDAGTAPRR
jgi:acetyl esterase/lipase